MTITKRANHPILQSGFRLLVACCFSVFYGMSNHFTNGNEGMLRVTLVELNVTRSNLMKNPIPIYGTLRALIATPDYAVTDMNGGGKPPQYGKNTLWDKKNADFTLLKPNETYALNTSCSFLLSKADIARGTLLICGELNSTKNTEPLHDYDASDQIIRLELQRLPQKKILKQRFGSANVEIQATYWVERMD